MPCCAHPWPDWRDEEQYAPLLEAERSGFAWEWLRRMPAYRQACEAGVGYQGQRENEERAARWGLHRFEAPDLPSWLARPLWRRDHFRYVLEAAAEQGGPPYDRFDLKRFEGLATMHKGANGEEHLLLSDGSRSVRLDIVSGSLEAGPARLHYRLAGFAAVTEPLLVVQRLLALWSRGRFSPALHPREVRARRWVQLLRTHDALAEGASQREIAERLVSREAATPRWRVTAPTVRSRVQRLARTARQMTEMGHLSYLGATPVPLTTGE